MFAVTLNNNIPFIVEDKQGTEQDSAHIKFVIEDTESSVAEVDKIYVELNED